MTTVLEQGAEQRAPGIWETWTGSAAPVKAMLAGTFVNKLGAFFQTFLVLFLTHRGFSELQAGGALGCFGAGALIGVFTGGSIADRLGPRTTTLTSMAGSAALLLTVLYVHTIPALLVVVTLVGLVGQLYRPASATLLTELTPQHQQVMVFALYRWALNLGTTVAPLLGALLISMSFQLLFWSEAATAAAFAVIAAVALPRRVPVASTQAPTRSARGGYRAVFGDRRYLRFLLATALNSLVYIQYVSTLPLAMRDAGLATIWFSCVIALNGFIVISCELLVTKLTQRWPVRRVIAAGFLLLGIGFSFYALPLGLAAFVLGTLVWTSAEIVAGPTMFAYPGRVAPDQLRGRYVAAMQTMFSLGSVAGPALGVVLYRAIGAGFWLCCGATCLVGLVLAASAIGRPDQQVQEVQEVQEAQEVQVTA